MASPPRLRIYDATLRDGAQGEGVSFSLEDKKRLTLALDRLGVDYIEGGWPGANPKDDEYFAALRSLRLRHAEPVAFGATRRPGKRADEDPQLRAVAAAGPRTACIVGKASLRHVRAALRATADENRAMVASSVAFLKKRLDRVFFDAEHFFDGFADDPEATFRVLDAALDAGADCVTLCDTNGGSLPDAIARAVRAAAARYPSVPLGIHAHNDGGLAVANTLVAVENGVTLVQGCLNGFGERCGAADLCQVIPNLQLKMGRRVLSRERLAQLGRVSRLAYEFACRPLDARQPFVGHSAFAHKGGLHVSAVNRDPSTYEHIDPAVVGNARRVLISEMSGRANLRASSPDMDDDTLADVLRQVRALELTGYSFDNATGSFELLLRRRATEYTPPFVIESFRVIDDNRRGAEVRHGGRPPPGAERARMAEASVRVRLRDGTVLHTVDESVDGPVSALDGALRKALAPVFPSVKRIRLIDFQVHIVNAEAATGARVRVVIQSRAERTAWGTVGVSEDIMEASCIALRDSMEYAIVRHDEGGRPPRSATL